LAWLIVADEDDNDDDEDNNATPVVTGRVGQPRHQKRQECKRRPANNGPSQVNQQYQLKHMSIMSMPTAD
jgi:hypothetical protein